MMMRHASVSLFVLALVACGGDKPEAKVPETTSTPASTEPAATPPSTPEPVASAPAAETKPAAEAPAPLTDENIAAIAAAANTAEVEHGKLATTKAKNAKVKKFAQMMATDHGDVAKKHTELLKKEKLTPAEHAMSTQMTSDASAMATSLNAMTGADFDKAYMEGQVKMHQQLLDALDQKLIPGAKNAALKAELTTVKTKVEAHLKQAQGIVAGLGGGATGSASMGSTTGSDTKTGAAAGGDKAGAAKPDTMKK